MAKTTDRTVWRRSCAIDRGPLAVVLSALLLSIPAAIVTAQVAEQDFAARFAGLALDCVHREYPNKIAHVLQDDQDVAAPRELTPAFFGCYDWHSSVHGHWLLARLARTYPEAEYSQAARDALAQSLTSANIDTEVVYFGGTGRVSFERPYGIAWLLQLAAELREWQEPLAADWSINLVPVEKLAAQRIRDWLPKLEYPIRSGEHSQTAFAFGLILDWARTTGDENLEVLVYTRGLTYYFRDEDCPLDYEPSGQDFLSPCLAEADFMRRLLEPKIFAFWLTRFLPEILTDGSDDWLRPVAVSDPGDPKLAHLDGLNLSRAWMLDGIAHSLPGGDDRRTSILAAALAHREAGLAAVTGERYEGGHWLGSFATYLVTRRGID